MSRMQTTWPRYRPIEEIDRAAAAAANVGALADANARAGDATLALCMLCGTVIFATIAHKFDSSFL
jgi:hypothetical protein